jgi:hypothetical protein
VASVKTFQPSFSGGEVTPEFFGRIDDTKYHAGLATCKNFIPLPHGPVENRPGFQFVRAVKDSSAGSPRLIPFTYSTSQTMVLEFGNKYIRFHSEGETLLNSSSVPYEVSTPYLIADVADIHYVQSADVMTLVHKGYPPKELRRYGATNWTLTDIDLQQTQTAPTSLTAGATAAGQSYNYTYEYVVTSIGEDGVTESAASSSAKCANNLYATGAYNTLNWSAVSGATLYNVYKNQGGLYGYIGQTSGTSIVDDDIDPDMSKTPPIYDLTFHTGGIKSVAITSGGSGYQTSYTGGAFTSVTVTNYGSGYGPNTKLVVSDPTGSGATFDVTVSGTHAIIGVTVLTGGNHYTNPTLIFVDTEWNDDDGSLNTGTGALVTPSISTYALVNVTLSVTDATGSGAVLTPIISNGVITGVTVSNQGSGYTAPTVTVSEASGGSGVVFGTITLSGTDYPGAVSYFEQRRCFAGTTANPQKIWMTRSGTESNMSYSLPVRDDDRVAFRIAAREVDVIRHIVPLSQMLLLTGSTEWRVTSVNSDAITPSSISVSPQSYIGASNVQPVIVNNTLIYGAARGGHVRELAYDWKAGGFATGDLSLRSTHLFDGDSITDIAYVKAPLPIVWFVSSSGKLLGLTYVPEQEVGAWHQHDTDGSFEACCVVAEGDEDRLYVVVKRTINGATVRYIERMASRQFSTQAEGFFVDCGLTYSGSAATTISGLSHLEGKTVNILADGAVHSQQVVSSGRVTLDAAASVVHIGLPITADIKSLPLAIQVDNAYGQGRAKNINRAWVRVYRSGGVQVGPDEDDLIEAKPRSTETYGSAPTLKSDEVEVVLTPSWRNRGGQVVIRQTDPLPLTVLGLTLEVGIGG